MEWQGLPVTVAGAGVSGTAAARVLRDLGARVTVVDDRAGDLDEFPVQRSLPDELGLVVTSPGFRPTVPMLVEAASRGVEVIGEVELAWRLSQGLRGESAAPWVRSRVVRALRM